jgi:hypothetical protein
MQLKAQQLSEVVGSLRDRDRQGRSGAEKRRFSRMEVHAKLEVVAVSPDITPRQFTALAQNISFGGIRFTQSVPLTPNHEVVVLLPNGRRGNLFIRCRIAHVNTLAQGIFDVGARFEAEVDAEFVQNAAANGQELQRIRDAVLDLRIHP